MTIFYSPSSAGFLDDGIHDVIPADAVTIAAEDYRQLMAAQTQGMQIVSGADGVPIAVDRPGLTVEEELEALRAERNRRGNRRNRRMNCWAD